MYIDFNFRMPNKNWKWGQITQSKDRTLFFMSSVKAIDERKEPYWPLI